MINWWIFTFSMMLPGFAEFYAAYKLVFFVREKGGLLPFLFCFLSGLFDLGFSTMMVVLLLLEADLRLEFDLTNLIVLFVVIGFVLSFFSWRIASAAMSLWLAGLLQEKTVRGLIRVYVRDRRKIERGEDGDVR